MGFNAFLIEHKWILAWLGTTYFITALGLWLGHIIIMYIDIVKTWGQLSDKGVYHRAWKLNGNNIFYGLSIFIQIKKMADFNFTEAHVCTLFNTMEKLITAGINQFIDWNSELYQRSLLYSYPV